MSLAVSLISKSLRIISKISFSSGLSIIAPLTISFNRTISSVALLMVVCAIRALLKSLPTFNNSDIDNAESFLAFSKISVTSSKLLTGFSNKTFSMMSAS